MLEGACMTILHIALFRWNTEATEGRVKALSSALDELSATMPSLISYEHGRDLGLREGTFDYGIVAEFGKAEQVSEYLDHPRHQAVIREFVAPILDTRSAVQIQSGRAAWH